MHAASALARQIGRMAYELLLQRIDERLAALDISERKACLNAKVDPGSIQRIRHRGTAPKIATLAALEKELRVPTNYFVDAAKVGVGTSPAQLSLSRPLETIYVRGFVQAGVWRPAVEWDAQDWYAYTVPHDTRYPGVNRYGLEVRGSSMNLRYPDGTIVVVARYADIGEMPQPGDKVIALRRARTGDEYEATVKELVRDERGRYWLWPRSDDPEHQQPIPLTDIDPAPSAGSARIPTVANANGFAGDGGEPDLVILAKVLMSVQIE